MWHNFRTACTAVALWRFWRTLLADTSAYFAARPDQGSLFCISWQACLGTILQRSLYSGPTQRRVVGKLTEAVSL